MKNVKWIVVSLALVAVVALLAGGIAYGHNESASGQGWGNGPMRGVGMMGHMGWAGHHGMMGDKDREDELKALDAQAQFLKQTSELRLQYALKRIELRKLWLAEDPDYAKVRAVSKELAEMQLKLMEKAPERGYGYGGMGMGGMMHGPGWGMGPMHGMHWGGGCW